MKHLQHPDETSETLETYAYMGFQRNVILLWTNQGLSLWSLMPARRSKGDARSSTGRLKTKLTLLTCLLEQPSWRLAGLVEAATASGPTTVERSRGEYGHDEHGRARAGSAVEAAACDWQRSGGAQHNGGAQERERAQWRILFFRQDAGKREQRHDSEWGRRIRPHGHPCGIIID
jgi:hypothetical protein